MEWGWLFISRIAGSIASWRNTWLTKYRPTASPPAARYRATLISRRAHLNRNDNYRVPGVASFIFLLIRWGQVKATLQIDSNLMSAAESKDPKPPNNQLSGELRDCSPLERPGCHSGPVREQRISIWEGMLGLTQWGDQEHT